MTLLIRPEAPADIAPIHAVTTAAFLHAPHTSHTEQFIVKALRANGMLVISLVAERDSDVVGHVAVSPATLSDGTANWFGLGPLFVLPEQPGNGIGSRLMQEALHRLKTQGAAGCVLLGDPAYYHRFGFKPESALVLPGVPAEYFQALLLSGDVQRGV